MSTVLPFETGSKLPPREQLLQEVDAAENRANAIKEVAARYGVYAGTVRRHLRGIQGQGSLNLLCSSNYLESVITSTPLPREPVLEESEGEPQFEPSLEPEPEGDDSIVASEKYHYNPTTDTYITFLDRAGKRLRFSGDKHRAMLSAYSSWDGHTGTINEICRTYGMTRPWFVEYKTVHGWTHDHEPFTAEEMASEPEEVLVERALTSKRLSVYRKFEAAKWNEIQSGYEKWVDLEQNFMLPLMEHVKNHAPNHRQTLLPMPAATAPFIALFVAFDLHYGKGAWRDETGESYSRDEARSLLLAHAGKLASHVARYGRPEYILVPLGSDWMHVDNPQHMTTAGTPQDMDGSYARMVMEGMELAVEYVELLRQIAPVVTLYVDGNHDQATSLSMAMYCKAWFRNCPDVTSVVAPTPRAYHEYGNNLIGATHGNDCKLGQLGALMAQEEREAWGRTENRFIVTGHLHHKVEADEDGITIFQSPSLSGADRWHARKGFKLSRRAMVCHIIDKYFGQIATLTSPVMPGTQYGFKLPGKSYARAA